MQPLYLASLETTSGTSTASQLPLSNPLLFRWERTEGFKELYIKNLLNLKLLNLQAVMPRASYPSLP